MSDIQDGMSNTIMLVEADQRVPWTKPEDIEYSVDAKMPELFSRAGGGFQSLFADGATHSIKNENDEKRMRAMISRNGREDIQVP